MTLSMDALLERTARNLQLAGKSDRTVVCYVREVSLLSEFHGRPADELAEEEVRSYLLHRQRVEPPRGVTPRPERERSRNQWRRDFPKNIAWK